MALSFVTTSINGLYCLRDSTTNNPIYKLVGRYMDGKARMINKIISPYMKDKVLDVGTGSGVIACHMMRSGLDVTGIDVEDKSMYEDVKPKIYNGYEMPFGKNEFDVAIIIHVLHHCDDPVEVLKEAKRVAKRVIFIEDTYRNKLEKMVVSACDMVGNFEFYSHKYKTVSEWKKVIRRNKWKTLAEEEWSSLHFRPAYSRYAMFVIE